MRLRAWALATATTTCLLAGCSGTEADPGSGGDGSDASASADLVTEGPETEDLLVHGTVVRDGEPVEDAAVRVALMAEDLDSLEIGEEVPMWETPSVETGEEGRFAVRLAPDEIDEQFFRPGADYLNFLLRVESDGVMAERSAAAALVGEDAVWRSEGAEPADPVIEMVVDLGEETVAVTDSQGETAEHELAIFEAPQQ